MSTEARRAPIPPRPAEPPRPATPPRPTSAPQGHAPETVAAPPGARASAPPAGDAEPGGRGGRGTNRAPAAPAAQPGDRGGESWTGHGPVGRGGTAPGNAGEPSHHRGRGARADAAVPSPPGARRPEAPTPAEPASPADDADDEEPSVFAPRAARNPAGRAPEETRQGGERSGAARAADGPRFPAFPSAAVPGGADPSGPPPPPASARFPDAPPTAARAVAPARRPGAPAESAAETTTRLRPVPAAPEQRRSGSAASAARPGASAESAAETTTRLRPVPAAPEQRRSGSASGSAPGRGGSVPASGPDRPASGQRPAATRPASAQAPAGPASQPPPAPDRSASGQRPAPSPRAATPPAPASPPGSGPRDGRPAWSPGDPARPASPAPVSPDPVLSWSADGAGRPFVSFGAPEYGERPRTRTPAWLGPRTAAAAACLVLGLGLIGGAVTGSWLTGDGPDGKAGTGFSAAGTLWHSVPVDRLFPPTVQGTGAGPGGADRTWTRIAVAPDSGCAGAFDPLLRKVLAPVGCRRLLRATYTDATQSHVTTVGLLFTKGDPAAMSALAARFRDEHLDRRADLMPRPYAAKGTAAARFGDGQRATWTVSVLTDAPVVAYAVSGWADGRTVDSPQPAADAARSGAGSAAAQAGLGQEAQGLADRVERRLRQTAGPATESPS
ncbi:hypothetical protein ABZ467_14535 [Streptomyces sp. NPDC005727]|uniref:hypothetical protein n=1 Tax=Streptomyces sp. NPDC005727 TaxID=3157053 RepID=UPI0033C36F5E